MIRIAKQQMFVYKIHSSRLRANKWSLTLPLDEARRNDEIISLAPSQMLRWIDEMRGINPIESTQKVAEIRREIREIRKKDNSVQNRRRIRELYKQLDDVQFKPDYMCLVIDRNKDYYRASKGFSINGVEYARLLGTNGGIKNSTIVFVNKEIRDELNRRVNNDRDESVPLVTDKLEAYKALACSASEPLSFPKGVLIVNDVKTSFLDETVLIDDEGDGEPTIKYIDAKEINNNASDGFGLMLPSLAKRWSNELNLDYVVGGINTRFSFEKGMVYTFDFLDFGEKIANSNFIVKDAWGDNVDIREVELILTTSMVKLWDSYKSCCEYLQRSLSNGYTFSSTKTSAHALEAERGLNYQFIQSYDLADADVEKLIKPTMDEIKEVLKGDWRKTVLFLKGIGLNERNVKTLSNDFIKAIMIDKRVLNDGYVQSSIYQLIKNRINQAKVGVIKVHGNYSLASGDPYALCQSIYNLKVTGLLKRQEIYNKYWENETKVACFRAPMTCHNNIRLVKPVKNDDVSYWYRYMDTITIFNAWDTCPIALNGMDFDGDLVLLTNNEVLVNNLVELPALTCPQRQAKKIVPKESDFIASNIRSFGNDIGQTTNWITSMFEVRSRFKPNSREYKVLSYRIRCGQLYQQNAIDKAKGIISKPMPRNWHDRYAVNKIECDKEKKFYDSIVADKKPYFMRYIYPALMKRYNVYKRNTDKNALRRFQMTVAEMKESPKPTKEQREFLRHYDRGLPVGVGDCVMNRICLRFEDEFDGYVGKNTSLEDFDYRIMKSNAEYTATQFNAIKRLYKDFNSKLRNYAVFADYERLDDCTVASEISIMNEEFRRECSLICSDSKALCNIILDLCYTRSSTKRFAWSMCGDEIIDNLLKRNNHHISFPTADESGDIEWCGNRYSIKVEKIDDDDDDERGAV